MAIRLHGWLYEKIETQLLLGNDWLCAKNTAKVAHVNSGYPGDYTGLYHDNGSCLDIILAFPPNARDCLLQVAQTDPLILTDDNHQIIARLDPACIQAFLGRFPHLSHLQPQAVLAVRRYTIRYTSYGPPRHRLQLIVHTANWIASSNATVPYAVPLHQVDDVSSVLRVLDHTRAIEDGRCLRPPKSESTVASRIAEQASDEEGIMAPVTDDSAEWPQTQQPYTQANFATQMAPAIRSRTHGGKSQVLRNDRSEPIVAETTQRRGNGQAPTNLDQEALLGLLGRKKRSVSHVQSDVQPSKSASSRPGTTTPSRPLETTTPRQSSSVRKDRTATTYSPTPPRRKDPATEVEAPSPASAESPLTRQVIEEADDQDDSITSMECSWMKGFVFNAASMVPDSFQQRVLNQDSSWYKMQPGVMPFPERNMPIRHYERICAIADETAAAQGHTQSDDEEPVDPSPDSDPEETEVTLSLEVANNVPHDDEPRTSQISWSASPTPEPPQRPESIQRGLPPDSSLEEEAAGRNTTVTRVLPTMITSPTKDREPSAPPSSPPGMDIPADSDEEMEMEVSVPQALGDDTTEGALEELSGREVDRSQSTRVKSVVQVRETPYGKGGQKYLSPRGRPQASPEKANISSSTSVALGTYDQPTLLTPAKETSGPTAVSQHVVAEPVVVDSSSSEEQIPTNLSEPATARSTTINEVVMIDSSPRSEEQMKIVEEAKVSEHSVPPPQDAYRQSASGSTKRKLAESPTKPSRRQSKRRELKIVGFGSDPPLSLDPALALLKDRADSLQRFREARKSSTSIESRAGSAPIIGAEQIAEAMDIDTSDTSVSGPRGMSPRHQSPYDEPSPPKPLPKVVMSLPASPRPSHDVTQPQLSPMATSTLPSVHTTSVNVTEPVSEPDQPSTIFGMFQAAYPEYTGNEKHFKTQCSQMYQLDQEDKMVPKWQWDDFIIRNKLDYRKYLMDCADEGENPEPYHRFYKDNIRDTLFQKGVVGSRKVLLQALKELDAAPAPPVEEEAPRPSIKSRKSLPSAFNKPTHPISPIPETPRQRPRQSLPTTSHKPTSHTPQVPASARTSTLDRSSSKPPTPRPNLLSRLSVEPTPRLSKATEGTGDPFRDFYFALQRSTSLTGSDAVDRTKLWPWNLAGRPTVVNAPKRKVDVLTWGDVL